jgi:hypothetical protein
LLKQGWVVTQVVEPAYQVQDLSSNASTEKKLLKQQFLSIYYSTVIGLKDHPKSCGMLLSCSSRVNLNLK